MNTIEKENKMGVMPIGKLLFQMSLPMIISMLIQALYNIVDSMYVSQISENALTAVSLVFPIQNLMISIAAGTGVGINALLSKSLGEEIIEKGTVQKKDCLFVCCNLAILSKHSKYSILSYSVKFSFTFAST